MNRPPWVQWLTNTGRRLETTDGKEIEVWEFHHTDNQEVLSEWAAHFRNHYCPDDKIDSMRGRKSRKDYLNEIKFPSRTKGFGPAVRAGDFGEILVADYLQWILDHWVPRMRWSAKLVKNESPKGCDVIGFKFYNPEHISPNDLLTIFEAKTCFSRSSNKHRLQDAINDSAKDHIRIDESLNYLKQRLLDQGQEDDANKIERFQNPVDIPYREKYGAVAIFTDDYFYVDAVSETETTSHPNQDRLILLVIQGKDMMNLVHKLYKRAADEA